MDPTKKIGKIKEQVELENISRRRYPDKWGKLTDKDVNRFYNQDEVNKILRTRADDNVNKDIWPYVYTGHGDSYFLSKDMFESLVAKCRCGRPRTEGHSIKCLQKVQNKYFNDDDDNDDGAAGANRIRIGRALPSSSSSLSSMVAGDDDDGLSKRIQVKYNGGGGGGSEAIVTNDSVHRRSSKSLCEIRSQNHRTAGNSDKRIPETSNGMLGWPKSRFWEWEQSTKYISPVTKMHGYKVTERPYNVIFIG
ncbi:uncharacterized protein LOC129912286 [Episyrphus balteatus]|uniref:uncharacterized protein LOC129912286 n=1 Tax=Episyrphus balteatus TaxID=286459 RepID=UPI0024860C73|nr:uncharacterized protein LOC129912286 [Episyrphus balteatus]